MVLRCFAFAFRKQIFQNSLTVKNDRPENWIPLPDRIHESQVNLTLNWSADQRTTRAIERQAALMGFESASAYLLQLIASALASNEADTFVDDAGQLVNGCDLPTDAQITP